MKYMGSKARFTKPILDIVLKDRENRWYIEPFAGGMNVISKVEGNKRLANDINPYLIAMWDALVYQNWKPEKITKTFYSEVKKNKKSFPAHVVGWVGFNCSYSGKFFGGFAGQVTTKIGTVRDYQDEAIRNVLKQVPLMDGVTFLNKSYDQVPLPPNSIIYCDPPYKGTTKYADEFSHKDFWNWCRESAGDGHSLYVSEYAAPSDFEVVWSKRATSSLSANGLSGGNKISVERLFKLRKQ